jgi:hypothetical protein
LRGRLYLKSVRSRRKNSIDEVVGTFNNVTRCVAGITSAMPREPPDAMHNVKPGHKVGGAATRRRCQQVLPFDVIPRHCYHLALARVK